MRSPIQFRRDEHGAVTIEFVLTLPLLLALMALCFEVFDAYKSYSRASKASYAVSDIISRQTTINQTQIDELRAVLDTMMPWLNEEKILRVSNITYTVDDEFSVIWSYVSGVSEPLTAPDLNTTFRATLPDLAVGETLLLTEVTVPHRSLIRWFGLDDLVWYVDHYARPRFVSCITDSASACGPALSAAVDDGSKPPLIP